MPYRKLILILGFSLFHVGLFAQKNYSLDSLRGLVENIAEDTSSSITENYNTLQHYLDQAKRNQNVEDIIFSYQQLASLNYRAGNINKALHYYKLYAIELEHFTDYNRIRQDRFEKNLYENEIKALIAKNKELDTDIIELKELTKNFAEKNNWIFIGLKAIIVIALLMLIIWAYNRFKKPKKKAETILETDTSQTITDVLNDTKDELTRVETELDMADILVQQIITHPDEFFNENKSLRKKFLINLPKKLAGGDGLYISSSKQKTIIVVFDAPGNGAAGGLLSSQVYSLLDNLLKKHSLESPSLILSQLEVNLLNLFPAGVPFTGGIKMAICLYDSSLKTLTFSGADMDLFVSHKLSQTKLLGVAKSLLENNNEAEYVNTEIDSVRGTSFYLSTVGYWQQRGGFDNKPFGRGSFENAIESLASQAIVDHGKVLSKIHHDWKGGNEQDEDILVFGFGF